MQTVLHTAGSRGDVNHGWLHSKHSFSFANYYNPNRMNFGVLRVLNDDIITGGTGFGTHPHQNMEIISIPIYGALAHKDSMGNAETINPGEVPCNAVCKLVVGLFSIIFESTVDTAPVILTFFCTP